MAINVGCKQTTIKPGVPHSLPLGGNKVRACNGRVPRPHISSKVWQGLVAAGPQACGVDMWTSSHLTKAYTCTYVTSVAQPLLLNTLIAPPTTIPQHAAHKLETHQPASQLCIQICCLNVQGALAPCSHSAVCSVISAPQKPHSAIMVVTTLSYLQAEGLLEKWPASDICKADERLTKTGGNLPLYHCSNHS